VSDVSDVSDGSDETPAISRRDRRDRARRRKRQILIASAAALVVVGLGATVVAAGVLSDDSSGAEDVADDHTTSSTTTATVARPSEIACRPLTVADPLRLWIGGDSLAGSLGPSLGETTAATGVVKPVYYSKVSSGLTSRSFFDWPEEAATEMSEIDPEVVVFIIDTNDTNIVDDDDPEWRTEYAALVEEMMTVLIGAPTDAEAAEGTATVGGGRTVYWIGGPTLEDDRTEEIQQLNAVAQEVAAGHDEVTYVDAYALFSDENGEYADSLPDETGEVVQVRAGDGIHLTPEGGDRLAKAVFDLVDAQCNVTAQADPSQPQDVTETEGSDSIPGTYRPPEATTATTTPPSTSAPTTTAPSTTTMPPETSTTTTAPPTSSTPTE
jgi:hypothetical protein